MTIKEIEKLTGIPKANIRFYESEGLIAPERRENGYRSYNETHVEELKRIRLLRALEIPIDTIKELAACNMTLADALSVRKEQFARQHDQLALTEAVIERMLDNAEGYASVDVDTYIGMLEQQDDVSVKQDTNPKIELTWRRFWARMLDFALYNLLLFLLVPGLFGNAGLMLIRFGLDLVLFVAAETFMLAWFGTTPGKAVFGISVTDLEGKRLSVRNALDRTAMVAQHGLGFNLPFLTQYKQWESLKAVENGQELSWECESEVNFRDSANWRYLLFLILMIPVTLYPLLRGVEIETEKQEQEIQQEQVLTEQQFYAMRNSYRVAEVLSSADGRYAVEELPIVIRDDNILRFSYKGSSQTGDIIEGVEEIGAFVYVPQTDDSTSDVWELKLKADTEIMYQFRVEDDESFALDCYENAQMKWSWRLVEAEILKVKLYSEHSQKPRYPSWWHIGTFELGFVEKYATHLRYPITMTLIFPEEERPAEIVIREEFYAGSEMTVREHTAAADADGLLSFAVPLPELDEQCCSVFYIPYEGGEFVICFTYEPGEEKWDSFLYDL